jgi:hypothetical protein
MNIATEARSHTTATVIASFTNHGIAVILISVARIRSLASSPAGRRLCADARKEVVGLNRVRSRCPVVVEYRSHHCLRAKPGAEPPQQPAPCIT